MASVGGWQGLQCDTGDIVWATSQKDCDLSYLPSSVTLGKSISLHELRFLSSKEGHTILSVGKHTEKNRCGQASQNIKLNRSVAWLIQGLQQKQ